MVTRRAINKASTGFSVVGFAPSQRGTGSCCLPAGQKWRIRVSQRAKGGAGTGCFGHEGINASEEPQKVESKGK